ncbi:MAG: MFS transporter [Holophagales bacterium]|nr:MFS transporter [Holophagales bacterium]
MPQLIAARALQGLRAGGLMPVALTVTGDLYSIQERAKVQGLFSGVWGVASLIGPLLGAFLTVSFGWRSIFTINLPLGLLAFALVATQMVETREKRRDPLDLAGAATLAVGVTALLFAVLHRAGPGSLGLLARGGLLLLAVAFLAAFARLQGRREHSAHPPDLFTRVETAAPYLSGVLIGTSIYGVDTFVPLFVQGARGGSAGAAGAVVTPLVFGWSLSAAIAARFIVRAGFRRTARAGALLILAGFAGLGLAALLGAGVGWISLACGLVGLGLGPSSLSQVLVIQHVVPRNRRGIATSLVPFSGTVGGSRPRPRRRRSRRRPGQAGSGPTRRGQPSLDGGAATSPALPRHRSGRSCRYSLPFFVLAAVNLLVTGRYRAGTDGGLIPARLSKGRRPGQPWGSPGR